MPGDGEAECGQRGNADNRDEGQDKAVLGKALTVLA
jgi:hypothetical protein